VNEDSDDAWAAQAEAIAAVVADNRPEITADDMDAPTPTAMVSGFALVVEWVEPDGERKLSRLYPPHMTPWHADGMWHAALYNDW
jgi:hypothetical protein